MKKFIALAFGFFLLGNTLMAAYQYADIIGLNDGAHTLYAMSNSDNVTLTFYSNVNNWDTLTVQATDTNGNVTTNTVNITGSTANIGSLHAGDDLKFYLNNKSAVQGTANINWSAWGSGWDTTTVTYEYLHFGANYGKWGSQYIETPFKVDGTPTPTPTGQPLPGALAALLVGGAGAGAFAIRRKKTAAAK